jgi:poly-gamma-glutamate synthesis protein (capsule biosynthesis protein)
MLAAHRGPAAAFLTLILILGTGPVQAACGAGEVAKRPGHVPPGFNFAAVGDVIIQGPSLRIITARVPQIARHLAQANVTFGNFESNSFDLDSFEGHARSAPDGPVLLAPPEVARELRTLGFTLVSTANNHAGDWGPEGVAATLHTLHAAKLVGAGTGQDLAAARAAACASVQGAEVALVAVTSSFQNSDAAAAGRPGVSALHVATDNGVSSMDEVDRQQVLDAIRQARQGADLVWVSLHTHQAGPDPAQPTQFEVSLAHAAIDAGADMFVAHGPHQLRGIEIYKGRVIFYSLGNFAVMQPFSRVNPKPLVLPPGSIFTRREFFESVLATGRYERGHLVEVRLYPFELDATDDPHTHGLPEEVTRAAANSILERMRALSSALGTQLSIADGAGLIRIPER